VFVCKEGGSVFRGITPNQKTYPHPTDRKSVRILQETHPEFGSCGETLTCKDPVSSGIVQFKCSSDCDKAFTDLKEKLVSAPVGQMPAC